MNFTFMNSFKNAMGSFLKNIKSYTCMKNLYIFFTFQVQVLTLGQSQLLDRK